MDQDSMETFDTHADDEEGKYEDAGELEMSGAQQGLYLTRMPKMLWEALNKIHEDDEIRIGTLRVQGERSNPTKVSLMLEHPSPLLRYVPREFNLRTSGNPDKASSNTFVFSEKNLPGFKRKFPVGRGPTMSARSGQADRSRDVRVRGKIFRGQGYRKAIPKKTALVGHVQSEWTCLPVENAEYNTILEQRAQHLVKPKHELQLLEGGANPGNMMTAGTLGSNGTFNTFIKGFPQQHKKQQQQKATRMPKNELRDLLFDCFRNFKFWYIRDLRVKTKQPEPWLRECLEDIAELVRQGAHANTWRLKPSSTLDSTILRNTGDLAGFDMAEESVAPRADIDEGGSDALDDGDGDDDEDDDGNIKMEDVTI